MEMTRIPITSTREPTSTIKIYIAILAIIFGVLLQGWIDSVRFATPLALMSERINEIDNHVNRVESKLNKIIKEDIVSDAR